MVTGERVVSEPNPVEVHLHTEGDCASIATRVVLNGLVVRTAGIYSLAATRKRLPVSGVITSAGWTYQQAGRVPWHIFTVLRKNKLLQVGDGALKWLPPVVGALNTIDYR